MLRRDGYRVVRSRKKLSPETLEKLDILVIANPLHPSNDRNWVLPTPSAYTEKEISSLHDWVEKGGSLLLIADHMPFPGAAEALAKAFGVEFSNGFAQPKSMIKGQPDIFRLGSRLNNSVVTEGRNETERVDAVASFTGSAFKPPAGAIPLIVFEPGSISLEPERAWKFYDSTPKRDIGGWSQGALLEVGKGRVALFGEAAMFTAQISGNGRQMGMSSPMASQNHQFLLNVMHWLSRIL